MEKKNKNKQREVIKPKTHSARVLRILRKKEPQVIEATKKALIMKGHHTSETINEVLRDIASMVKPNCVTLNRKNEILPFEDANSIEFLGDKNDCSLFALGSHTKKRPNNLVMVSCFLQTAIMLHTLQLILYNETIFLSMKLIAVANLFVFSV